MMREEFRKIVGEFQEFTWRKRSMMLRIRQALWTFEDEEEREWLEDVYTSLEAVIE